MRAREAIRVADQRAADAPDDERRSGKDLPAAYRRGLGIRRRPRERQAAEQHGADAEALHERQILAEERAGEDDRQGGVGRGQRADDRDRPVGQRLVVEDPRDAVEDVSEQAPERELRPSGANAGGESWNAQKATLTTALAIA